MAAQFNYYPGIAEIGVNSNVFVVFSTTSPQGSTLHDPKWKNFFFQFHKP